MAKNDDFTEFEFELTGLKIRFKGRREELPNLGTHLSRQLTSTIQPAAALAAGEQPRKHVENEAATEPPSSIAEQKKKRRRKKDGPSDTAGGEGASVRSHIQGLVAEGFFTEPKPLGMIKERLKELGFAYKTGDLTPTMTRATRDKLLERRHDSELDQYVYFKPGD